MTQSDVKEAVAARVVNEQAEEDGYVGVAVHHRVEERAEDGDLVGLARHPSVHHVEDARADDDETRVEEHAVGVVSAREAEETRRDDVDDQPEEGQHVGRDLGQRQPVHDLL
jgi:hypothetical protein